MWEGAKSHIYTLAGANHLSATQGHVQEQVTGNRKLIWSDLRNAVIIIPIIFTQHFLNTGWRFCSELSMCALLYKQYICRQVTHFQLKLHGLIWSCHATTLS